MSRLNVLLLSLLAWVTAHAATVTTTSAPAAPTTRAEPLTNYRMIYTNRNVFNKDRRISLRTTTTNRGGRSSLSPEQATVLTGIILQEDCEQVAFFEDIRVGETLRVCAAQPLGRGVVKSVSLDSVEYQTDNGVRMIAIGENLLGQAVVPSLPSASSEGSASSEPSAASAPSGGGGGDVLERMRQRRQQELK